MKTIFAFLLLTLVLIDYTMGQELPQFVYCEIVGTQKLFSRKVTIEVDFGDKLSIWASNRLKDEKGTPIVFNSMMDALNYMGKQGWNFAQAYTIGDAQNGYVYHFLMQKPFEKMDDNAKQEFLKK